MPNVLALSRIEWIQVNTRRRTSWSSQGRGLRGPSRQDSGHRAPGIKNGIFPTGFSLGWRDRRALKIRRRIQHRKWRAARREGQQIRTDVERLPIEDLKLYQVQVKGMKVGSSVNHFPHFHGAHPRVLCDRVHPMGVIERQHQRAVGAIDDIDVRASRALYQVRSDEWSQIDEGR